MAIKKLESVRIDMKNGIGHVEVNGNDISSNGSYLNLTFENGEWSLMTTKDEVYSSCGTDDESGKGVSMEKMLRQQFNLLAERSRECSEVMLPHFTKEMIEIYSVLSSSNAFNLL